MNSVLCSFGLAASALRAALRVRQIGIDALIDKEFLIRLQMGSVRTTLSRLPEKRLRQVLVLYTRSKILVIKDSGPAHFAAMTPIHVVTLFGPETPALFAARSPNATALWAGIACSPCVNAYNNRQSVCHNNLCMQAITVDDVFEN